MPADQSSASLAEERWQAHGGKVNEAVADLHKALLRDTHDPCSPGFGRQTTWSGVEPGALVGGLEGLGMRQLKEPGAFRRQHLHKQAEEMGIPEDERPAHWNTRLLESVRPHFQVVMYEGPLGIRLDEDGNALPAEAGQSGLPQTILAIWKSFVGSGITFLPGAFFARRVALLLCGVGSDRILQSILHQVAVGLP